MRDRFIGLFIALVLLVGGCSSTSTPAIDENNSSKSEPQSTDTYLIGPGDNLKVFVWQNPDLSTTVPVRPDGKISTPLIEDMVAVGKTPTELARDMESVLSKYVKRPSVNIIVSNFVGQFSEQIRVVGQAAKPQALPYRESITLLDVMIEVGGLTEFASGNKAKIVRRYGGKEENIPVRIHDLINRGKIDQNVILKPGDIIIIPESFF
ncbi:MAG: XrtA/PEP-CTERM system exopolysaccharide export protein [Pseudomonadota bacterium]